MGTAIKHDQTHHRFFMEIDHQECELDYHQIDSKTLEYYRTFVPVPLRHQGLASRIADHALNYAKDHNLKIVASCPFVEDFINKHSEFKNMLAASK